MFFYYVKNATNHLITIRFSGRINRHDTYIPVFKVADRFHSGLHENNYDDLIHDQTLAITLGDYQI